MEYTAEKMLVEMLRQGIARRAEAPESERNHRFGAKDRNVRGKNLGYLRRRVMNKQIFYWKFDNELIRMMYGSHGPRDSDDPIVQRLLNDKLVTAMAISRKFPDGGLALTPLGHEYAKKLLTLEKL